LPVIKNDGKEVLEQVRQTSTLAERTGRAQQCVTSLNLSIPTLVDRPDNKVNITYAGWPDRIYVVGTDGRIAYKGAPGPRGFKVSDVEEWLTANLK
jgi:hypothetical protein